MILFNFVGISVKPSTYHSFRYNPRPQDNTALCPMQPSVTRKFMNMIHGFCGSYN